MPTLTTQSLSAEERISRARTRLILNQPFFGTLAMRLYVRRDDGVPTMCTDGTMLAYNESFVQTLSDIDLQTIMAHEVAHVCLLHPYRSNGRDHLRWNIACDFVVNANLVDAGFKMPESALIDINKYPSSMAAEQVYALLPDVSSWSQRPGGVQAAGSMGKDEEDGQDSAGRPEMGTGKGEGIKPMTAEDWQVAAEQAAMLARKAGNMPGGLDRSLRSSRAPAEDWRAILHEFIIHTVPCDYTWARPNRRFIGQDLYLPGTYKENAPRFAVAIDTSGSINQRLLELFAAELTGILHEVRPEAVDVIYCDTEVTHTESFSPDDAGITLNAEGGGGTLFAPVFEHLAAQPEPPAALIFFTDLENGDDKLSAPDYPVLWAATPRTKEKGPFGQTIHMSEFN